jgi:hypothetical protein
VKGTAHAIIDAMTGPGALILSVLMLAAFALTAGGAWLLVKRRDTRKGMLMLLCAGVMLANVLVWTV